MFQKSRFVPINSDYRQAETAQEETGLFLTFSQTTSDILYMFLTTSSQLAHSTNASCWVMAAWLRSCGFGAP